MLYITLKPVNSSVCFVILAMYLVSFFFISSAKAAYRASTSIYDVNYAYNIPHAPTAVAPVIRTQPVYEVAPVQSYAPAYASTYTPVYTPQTPYMPPEYNRKRSLAVQSWGGPYLGVLFGFTNSGVDLIKDHSINALKSSDLDLGVIAGMNFQRNTFIYGIEGGAVFPINKNEKSIVSIRGNFKANLRTRIGVAIGRWLPYGFIGVATNYSTVKDELNHNSDFKNFHFNYVYGAGADFKVGRGLFAKFEGQVNNTSKQAANLDIYKIHFKDHSYTFHLGLAEQF